MAIKKGSIIIVGAGSHGRVVLDILDESMPGKVVGFVDAFDKSSFKEKIFDGLPILGKVRDLPDLFKKGYKRAICACGDNRQRMEITDKLEKIGFEIVTAIHPDASISGRVKLAAGCMISAGAVIVTGTELGRSVIVNTGATVDHDNRLGEGAQIAPGAHLGGRVSVGKCAMVGLGASVIQGIIIGENAMVGAGAAVIRDVPRKCTVVGVPARVIKTDNENPSEITA